MQGESPRLQSGEKLLDRDQDERLCVTHLRENVSKVILFTGKILYSPRGDASKPLTGF
jgi:hypothetical protein